MWPDSRVIARRFLKKNFLLADSRKKKDVRFDSLLEGLTAEFDAAYPVLIQRINDLEFEAQDHAEGWVALSDCVEGYFKRCAGLELVLMNVSEECAGIHVEPSWLQAVHAVLEAKDGFSPLTEYSNAIRQHERERCARIAIDFESNRTIGLAKRNMACVIVEQIRALKDEEAE
jgi:hypothetical protein